MLRQRHARITLIGAVAAAGALGCAVSEPIDPGELGHNVTATGLGGADGAGTSGAGSAGTGGDVGMAGNTGTSGLAGTTGTTGSAGSGSKMASGSAGTGGDTGSAGTGGGAGSGQAGSGADAGVAGSAGRGGTSGSAGRGGSGGRGGAGGRGGTAGTGAMAGSGGSPDAGTGADAASTVTFTDVYTNILVVSCSGSSCHNPGSAKGLSFSSQSTAYTAVRNRVTPGNGAGSSFYSTVNSGSMPPGGPKLSAANLAKIKAWIDAGALNN